MIGGASDVGRAKRGERWVVGADRVVEAQHALVAEQQGGRGRERLGHRRDPVHGVLVDALAVGSERTETPSSPSTTTPHETVGQWCSAAIRGDEFVERGAIDGPDDAVSLAAVVDEPPR